MTRNLKALGLALVAMFAMSALVASVAQAAGERFHSHAENTVLTADGDGGSSTLTINNANGEPISTVTCSEFSAEGLVTGTETPGTGLYTAKEATVGFNYFGVCEASIGGKAEVIENGCHYLLTSETNAEGHAGVEIICPTAPIEIKTEAGCTIKVGSQPERFGVHYNNEPNTAATNDDAITGEATVKGISFTANFICQLGGVPSSGSNAAYAGNFTVEGFEGSGSTGAYEEGAQVGISKQ